MEETIKKIVKYIAAHSERESIFATPCPQWEINSHQLLEYVVEVTDVTTEQVTAWVDEAVKESEGKEV